MVQVVLIVLDVAMFRGIPNILETRERITRFEGVEMAWINRAETFQMFRNNNIFPNILHIFKCFKIFSDIKKSFSLTDTTPRCNHQSYLKTKFDYSTGDLWIKGLSCLRILLSPVQIPLAPSAWLVSSTVMGRLACSCSFSSKGQWGP